MNFVRHASHIALWSIGAAVLLLGMGSAAGNRHAGPPSPLYERATEDGSSHPPPPAAPRERAPLHQQDACIRSARTAPTTHPSSLPVAIAETGRFATPAISTFLVSRSDPRRPLHITLWDPPLRAPPCDRRRRQTPSRNV